jgi:hypothetical protein
MYLQAHTGTSPYHCGWQRMLLPPRHKKQQVITLRLLGIASVLSLPELPM